MKKLVLGAFVALFGSGLWAIGCGSSDTDAITGPGSTAGSGGGGGADSGSPGTGGGTGGSSTGGSSTGSGGSGAGCTLKLIGDACAADGDCCTGHCDPGAKICAVYTGQCKAAGATCGSPQECCTFVCNGGTCGSSQCTTDGQACTSAGQCCSGTCGPTGTCTPLNPGCRTGGNACTTNAECCGKLCSNGVCSTGGSFCTQTGDVCANDAECCGGLCTKASGATVGTCHPPSAPGATECTVAGQACGGVVGDAGIGDGGLPSCGGSCCSRACAPFRSGLFVCQPPSGCRPTGEVCRDDSDCCGFGGIQGKTGVGNCSKEPGAPVGRCDNGNACRPAGAICKLASMSCNAENNCCAGNVNQNPYVCQQDILGIPRCTMKGEGCNDAGSRSGQACATSADCCGLPCAPNPAFKPDAGVPPYVCGGGVCVGTGGSCTTNADCCPGLPCIAPPGSTRGTCGGPPPTGDGGNPPPGDSGNPPPADGSVVDGPAGDGYVPPPPPGCAGYGQVCTTNGDCCNGVPCTGGRCVIIVN